MARAQGTGKPTLLYVTDLYYEAAGRPYHEEDLYLASVLRPDFDLVLCQPTVAIRFVGLTDGILFRNTGPVLHYPEAYAELRQAVLAAGTPIYNTLTGKADMQGKQYLVDLTRAGYPVIPTVDDAASLARLPDAGRYVVKSKRGADSIGMTTVEAGGLEAVVAGMEDAIVQPLVDFDCEVSFYFVDRDLQYALYAPDRAARWRLEPYAPTAADRAFAQRFVDWNDIDHGIQRVDACRMPSGDLLLMELEDINPYLSLDRLDDTTRDSFVLTLRSALAAYVGGSSR